MTESIETNEDYTPEVAVSYALADKDGAKSKEVETLMSVLLNQMLEGNLAVVDCVRSDVEDSAVIPVIAVITEVEGQQAILPLGRLFTEEDKPSQTLVPVVTDPRQVN